MHLGQNYRGQQREGLGRRGDKCFTSKWPPKIPKIIVHIYFGLPGLLWTSFKLTNWFSDVKKNARRGYTNVTCFQLAKMVQKHHVTFLTLFKNSHFLHLFTFLPSLPDFRAPLLGSPNALAALAHVRPPHELVPICRRPAIPDLVPKGAVDHIFPTIRVDNYDTDMVMNQLQGTINPFGFLAVEEN